MDGDKRTGDSRSHHPVLKMKLHFWDGYNSKDKYKKKYNNMKPGDKVWVFSGEGLIRQVTIAQIYEGYIWCYDAGNRTIVLNKDYPIFSTREALCEHYRKIFE